MSTYKRIPLSFILITLTLVLGAGGAHALDMTSDRYHIQFGNVNIGGKTMNDAVDDTYNLTTTLGQTAAGQFNSDGYIVKAGFQYIYSKIPFTFSVSSIRADLGTLTPNTPSTIAIDLAVSFGGAGQYVVTAGEKGPLRNFDSVAIPNTSCNGGVDTCSITLAKPWTSLAAYGFGYSMAGTDIPADFIDATYYRPFADLNVPETPATVMQSIDVTENLTPTPNPQYTPAPALTGVPRDTRHQSTMTFKANISPLQSAGSYNTVIHFVATPSF